MMVSTIASQTLLSKETVCTAEQALGEVRTLCFRPAHSPRATFVYLHDGGIRLRALDHHTSVANFIAVALGVEVIVPDYRLAPKSPFPAAISNALRALKALDRAGGGTRSCR